VPQEGEKPAPASSLTNFKSIGYQRCRPEGLLSDGTIFLATSPKASFALVSEQGEITHRASLGDPMDRARHVVQRLIARHFAFTFGHIQKKFMSWSAPQP
jgi:hypothetical protein